MSNELKCPICGNKTRMYYGNPRKDGLCGEHADMLKDNIIYYNCLTDEYCYTDTKEPIKANKNESQKTESECIICGFDSKGKEVCRDCYKEIMNEYDEIDKNQKPWELKDYYYNLKASIGRLKNYEYVINNTYRLYAIAWCVKWMYNDEQLSDVIAEDVKKIIKAKEKIKEFKIDEKQEQTDKAIIAATNIERNRAVDGHICKSAGEVTIDNLLYRNQICHAYQRAVKEIDTENERAVVSDWYIPLSGTKGIYIEYWGMDNKDYQDNKEEKLQLYKKHNLKLIEINKNDINSEDNLEDYLYRQLIKFGWKPQED